MVNTLGVFLAVALTAHGALRGRLTAGDILLVLTLAQSLIDDGRADRPADQPDRATSTRTAERLVELLEVERRAGRPPPTRSSSTSCARSSSTR